MKKKSKENSTKKNDMIDGIKEEFKRHTGVLMEQMRHEVKTVAEGHGAIIRKLEEHDKKFDKIDQKLEIHDKKFGKIESELNSVKSELHSVKMAVMDTNQTVKSIDKKLDNHETRIIKLEEKVHI